MFIHSSKVIYVASYVQSGLTPLHVASFMGHMNIAMFLLQSGANPNYQTVRGETPLHLATRANQTDIIRVLLRHGAHVDAKARVCFHFISKTPQICSILGHKNYNNLFINVQNIGIFIFIFRYISLARDCMLYAWITRKLDRQPLF